MGHRTPSTVSRQRTTTTSASLYRRQFLRPQEPPRHREGLLALLASVSRSRYPQVHLSPTATIGAAISTVSSSLPLLINSRISASSFAPSLLHHVHPHLPASLPFLSPIRCDSSVSLRTLECSPMHMKTITIFLRLARRDLHCRSCPVRVLQLPVAPLGWPDTEEFDHAGTLFLP